MKCLYCGHESTRVIDTRLAEEGEAVRRRRQCRQCGRRFTTYERVEQRSLIVIKKDGRRESFDRQKVLRGMLKACEKRPIPQEVLEAAALRIERELRRLPTRQVPSRRIGEMVMEELRKIDEVAYVRFASVYREFGDASGFLEEVAMLVKGEHGEESRQR